ncbi:MAG: ROK family protein [Verrucomicrobiales bacterium]
MKAIGVDFGGTTVKIGLCVDDQLLDKPGIIPTHEHETAEELIDAISSHADSLRAAHPDITALGVGVPGFVDFAKGYTHKLTNVHGWDGVPLRDLLAERLGLIVAVDNDANCMAYAEWRAGAGQGSTNMLAITLGTGVGGGLILNGRMHRGASSGAGEVGQMSIHWEGRTGVYNNRGCLEQYIGHRQITQHAHEIYKAAGIDRDREECDPAKLAQAAHSGDRVALGVWDDVARMLACELCNVCWLVSPDTIVIGGGIAGAEDVLFDPLRKHMQGQLHPVFWESLRLVPAHFGNEAGIIGAARLALDQVDQTPPTAAQG